MAVSLHKTLRQLRNTRDLRAEILSLAAQLATSPKAKGSITVTAPVINQGTVQEEWDRLLPAIAPEIRERMSLSLEPTVVPVNRHPMFDHVPGDAAVELIRPNYRYEVIRLLIETHLRGETVPISQLIAWVGASQTPVRAALADLKAAGIVDAVGRHLKISLSELSNELLARVAALPQTLHFRFAQGAQLKPPAVLLDRCVSLLQVSTDNTGWGRMALSGMAVAQQDVPGIDLAGMPRLDLVAQLPHSDKTFDTSVLRQLDDGLELETNVLAPTPVVITFVRANLMWARIEKHERVSQALHCDVFLSLLDMGLRDQAIQYAKAVRA